MIIIIFIVINTTTSDIPALPLFSRSAASHHNLLTLITVTIMFIIIPSSLPALPVCVLAHVAQQMVRTLWS